MKVKDHYTVRQLQAMSRGERDARVARRIGAVAMALRGESGEQIARSLGYSPRAVRGWIHRYNRGKVQALRDQPRSGRKPHLTADQQPAFRKRLEQGPIEADGVVTFTGLSLQRILEREFGVLYKLDAVYKLLHRLGYSWLMPRPRHEQADPQAREAFKKTSDRNWRRSSPNTRTSVRKSSSRTRLVSASRAR